VKALCQIFYTVSALCYQSSFLMRKRAMHLQPLSCNLLMPSSLTILWFAFNFRTAIYVEPVARTLSGRQAGIGLLWYPKPVLHVTATVRLFIALSSFCLITFKHAESEVLTAIVRKSSLLWNVTPCSPVNFNVSFGGTFHLHHHCWRVSQARNQDEAGSFNRNTWQYILEDRMIIYK
jgi:hypothetical protein